MFFSHCSVDYTCGGKLVFNPQSDEFREGEGQPNYLLIVGSFFCPPPPPLPLPDILSIQGFDCGVAHVFEGMYARVTAQ